MADAADAIKEAAAAAMSAIAGRTDGGDKEGGVGGGTQNVPYDRGAASGGDESMERYQEAARRLKKMEGIKEE